MATALSSFFEFVLPWVQGCSDAQAESAVRSACIEFSELSLISQVVSKQDVTATVQDYAIAIPAQMRLAKVTGVWHADAWMSPNTTESVRSAVALRGETIDGIDLQQNTPQVYFLKTAFATSVSLFPVPVFTITNGLTIRAAFSPTRAATTVDDLFFNYYAEAIGAGAVARLMAMPAQPFSSPNISDYRARFLAIAQDASNVARIGLSNASSRVRLQPFA